MIRLTTPDDINILLALAEATGLFESNQIEELAQMLNQHFSDGTDSQDIWFTDYDNKPVGVAYVAPERMTDGTWNLYLIANCLSQVIGKCCHITIPFHVDPLPAHSSELG